jgi:hypothetical protein
MLFGFQRLGARGRETLLIPNGDIVCASAPAIEAVNAYAQLVTTGPADVSFIGRKGLFRAVFPTHSLSDMFPKCSGLAD